MKSMLRIIVPLGRRAAVAAIAAGFFHAAAFAQESPQIAQGRTHYAETCALCHGLDGKRGEGFQTPIWGEGAMIGSKFGNVQALIDYMQLMPFNDPSLLDDAQKLAVVAFLLANHGTIKPSDTLDPATAPNVPIK